MSDRPKIIVAKFGGTSMGDAKSIARVADIVLDQKPAVVVVSATSGTTNLLEELAHKAHKQESFKNNKIINSIRVNHITIAKDLGIYLAIKNILDELIGEIDTLVNGMQMLRESPKSSNDRLMSTGERMSSLLLEAYLNKKHSSRFKLIDAREIIRTNGDHGRAQPDYKETSTQAQSKMLPYLERNMCLITQGFIGRSIQGNTTTLGRGGSDFSAAIIAEAVQANELQIWTDVSGIASTDPRIVKTAFPIDELTYGEAAELAAAGAKILYPPTVIPTKRSKIPIRVLNTFEPNSPGTVIMDQISSKPLIRSIAIKKNQSLITLSTPLLNEESGFMSRIFNVFAKHKVSIDLITTSETSVAFTLDNGIMQRAALFDDLRSFVDVELEEQMSVVSIIGNRMNQTPGVATRIFQALDDSEAKINVRMICQGAYRHAMALVIDNKHGDAAVKALHKNLLEG